MVDQQPVLAVILNGRQVLHHHLCQTNSKLPRFVHVAVFFANTLIGSAVRRFACGEMPNTTR